jgi:hypothetical protein
VPFLAHLALHVDFHRAGILYLLTRFAEDPEGADHDPLSGKLRAAVVAELPALTGCLSDPDPQVRQQAIRMTVVAPRPLDPVVLGTVSDLYARDPDPWTRADALTALALIDPNRQAVRHREATAFADDAPEVRLSAALLGLERAQKPFPAALVDMIAACPANPARGRANRCRTRRAATAPARCRPALPPDPPDPSP